MIKKIFFLLLLLNSLLIPVKAEQFEIKHADNLEADKEKITINGNILIKYKDASIEAPNGIVETNSEGKPDKATFTGRVKISLKDRKLEADTVDVILSEEVMRANGNVISELKDKKGIPITIASDFQELYWSGQDANANGNLRTTYMDTVISSDSAVIIYKDKKPYQAIFNGKERRANLEDPNSITSAKQFVFEISSQNLKAVGNVKSVIWPEKDKSRDQQKPMYLDADELYVDQITNTITANGSIDNQIMLDYETTKGESNEGVLLRDKNTGKPKKLIFKGNANVAQEDKKLSSEEIVLNIETKKLISNTKDNKRPKTTFFKKSEKI